MTDLRSALLSALDADLAELANGQALRTWYHPKCQQALQAIRDEVADHRIGKTGECLRCSIDCGCTTHLVIMPCAPIRSICAALYPELLPKP